MIWRPVKRVRVVQRNGRTVEVVRWEARYRSEITSKIERAKPAWNDGRSTFLRERDAMRAIQEALAAEADPGFVAAPVSTVAEYLGRWLATHPRSPRTDATNRHRVGRVLEIKLEGRPLGQWPMRDLRRRHGTELVGAMFVEQHRNAGGCRAILRALSAMFEDAFTDGLCEQNPWKGAKISEHDFRAVKQRTPSRVWTFAQLHELASHGGVYEPMLRVLVDCGLRLGECLALERGDHQPGELQIRQSAWEGQLVTTSAEKNHERLVPTTAAVDSLIRAMPVRLHVSWLFPTPNGCMWRESNWRKDVLAPTIQRANVGRPDRIDPTAKEMRHSWVSNLRADGIDPADLADVAGHSVDTATNHYTHPLRRSFDVIREAVG